MDNLECAKTICKTILKNKLADGERLDNHLKEVLNRGNFSNKQYKDLLEINDLFIEHFCFTMAISLCEILINDTMDFETVYNEVVYELNK